jgi:hypothetical protein
MTRARGHDDGPTLMKKHASSTKSGQTEEKKLENREQKNKTHTQKV